MRQLLHGDEWTLPRFVRAPLHLDDDLDDRGSRVPLAEELRMVAALVVLACVAILLL
jgi:hypothetical protein